MLSTTSRSRIQASCAEHENWCGARAQFFSRACSSIFSSSHCSVLCVRCLQKHSTSTSSLLLLLFPSNRTNTCSPPTGLWFGRFAEQSPLTGYEANAPVEMSSTGATPIILLSRKGSIGSTCNSVDDLASTPAVSETSERVDLGMLASPLLSQETETSANPSRICHSNRESSETSFSHLRSGTGNPWRDVRTREIQVETRVLCKTLNQNEKKFFLSIGDLRNFIEMRADRAVKGERVAQTQLS